MVVVEAGGSSGNPHVASLQTDIRNAGGPGSTGSRDRQGPGDHRNDDIKIQQDDDRGIRRRPAWVATANGKTRNDGAGGRSAPAIKEMPDDCA